MIWPRTTAYSSSPIIVIGQAVSGINGFSAVVTIFIINILPFLYRMSIESSFWKNSQQWLVWYK